MKVCIYLTKGLKKILSLDKFHYDITPLYDDDTLASVSNFNKGAKTIKQTVVQEENVVACPENLSQGTQWRNYPQL